MKNRNEIKNNGKPSFYAILFNPLKEKAMDMGYSLAIHGSMVNDMDLIAVPWVEDAKEPEELVQAFIDVIGGTIWGDYVFKEKAQRPHNRVVYTLPFMGDWYIDLSIIKPIK